MTDIRVLLVEDNPGDARLIREMLRQPDDIRFHLDIRDSLEDGLRHLQQQTADVVLLDLSLPDSSGLEGIGRLHTSFPALPVVVLTGFDDRTLGLQALQAGAQDYLIKGTVDGNLLQRALHYAIQRQASEEALRRSEEEYRSLIDDVFNTSSVGVFVLNRDFKVVWMNDAAAQYFGLRREEVLGRDKREFIRDTMKYAFEQPDQFAARLMAAYEQNNFSDRFECHVLPSQARNERWIEHWSQPIRSGMYADGRIQYYSDITERKQIEFAEHEQRVLAEALRDAAAALTNTLNLDEVLDRILTNVERVVEHDAANIMLLEGDYAHIARYKNYANGNGHYLSELSFLPEETPYLAQMLQSHESSINPDIQIDAQWSALPEVESFHAYAGTPIRFQDETIGFINIFSATPNYFTYVHADRLKVFAEQAAIAIQNARLHRQSQELAAMKERQRLAHELHDSVSQTLFTSSVIAESALRQWKNNPDKSYSLLKQIHELTSNAMAEMRVLLLELRPKSLSQVSFEQLLRQFSQSVQARRKVDFDMEIDEMPPLPMDVKIGLYRIVQEALSNVTKHSGAQSAKITVKNQANRLELTISDDGQGIHWDTVSPTSMGLSIMRERAESINASLEINSAVGRGTEIKVIWRAPRRWGEKNG
jgi:PAS domain S-box-containing protein